MGLNNPITPASIGAVPNTRNLVAGANVTIDGGASADLSADVTIAATGGGGGGGGLYDISMGVPVSPTTVGASPLAFSENPGKGLTVKVTAASVTQRLGGWLIPNAGTPFNVCALMLSNEANGNYFSAGIGVHNATSGRYVTIYVPADSNTQAEFAKWNSGTSRASNGNLSIGGPSYTTPLWLHCMSDGTSLLMGTSHDGANPIWSFVSTLADWIGSVDNFFVGGYFESFAGQINGISFSCLCFDDNAGARVVGV